jgi:hypothetical protein
MKTNYYFKHEHSHGVRFHKCTTADKKTAQSRPTTSAKNIEELILKRPTVVFLLVPKETSPIIWIGKSAPAIQC